MDTNRPEATPDAEAQRRGLLDAQRKANQTQPRNFKEDALTDKVVRVEPDGTGPTSTGAFDPAQDHQDGSGHDAGDDSTAAAHPANAPDSGHPRPDTKPQR